MKDLRGAIRKAYRMDETQAVNDLLNSINFSAQQLNNIAERARQLVLDVRQRRVGKPGIESFLSEYALSSEEGIALMCLAEAMLRIPDKTTVDRLIADKISNADWEQHLGQSQSTFVNAATWGLMLTGKIVAPQQNNAGNLSSAIRNLIRRSGEPLIRTAVSQAMKIMGFQFVMGETIEEALQRSKQPDARVFRYSYDMLGEEALTAADADKYYANYMHAIQEIGKASANQGVYLGPGVSVKLSALHPRYEWRKHDRIMQELLPKIIALSQEAKKYNIGLSIDAEEADRLDLSLDLIEKLSADPSLNGWNGLGIVVQAYQKRAPFVIDWVIALAKQHQRRIMLRLVKGAYWDSELKVAQERGLIDYPVFTRKAATDVSYIACVQKIFRATDVLYPQFATHNAHTVAVILELANGYTDFEFQALHGMGDALYKDISPCRVYAPVGDHQSLLAYLVRRLLENGANTSFVNRIVDEHMSVEELIADPCAKMRSLTDKPHPKIPLPMNIYGSSRPNSHGIDFTNQLEYQAVLDFIGNYTLPQQIFTPATPEQIKQSIAAAEKAARPWSHTSPETRIYALERMARLLEQHKAEMMALLVHEGGKTLNDAIAEVREAIDFCWYYAARTRIDFPPQPLVGPTGEYNQLQLHARGVIACISPWNFPLAIFLGQVSAALLAGNAVLAKPAGQTPLVAARAIDLLHQAGIPSDVVQLLVGSGAVIGDLLVTDQRINGVMFTGSTETARHINQKLANRLGAIVPFIAETGGQNAMIVDSSALAEQVVKDVINSAFGSAGQRCSSLRVLYIQEDVADRIIKMLCGAMAQLKIGDPSQLSTDIGPVIDQKAFDTLNAHKEKMVREAKLLYEVVIDTLLPGKVFFAPCAFEIASITQLEGEVFGPILHIVRFAAADLGQVVDDINSTGFGLTMGIHSRIDTTIDFIVQRARVGNIYVNRNMIGAVVGVQPFGGENLSGTGPKAGGPYYLPRLATECTLSINTTAAGGNATVLSLQE